MSKEYKHVKNYVHNELGFNKPHVESLLESFLEKAIEKRVTDYLCSTRLEHVIRAKIDYIINNNKSPYWNHDVTGDFIKNEIRSQVKTEILARIDFDSLKIK